MINTVFFDIGGVLLDIHPQRTIRYWSDRAQLSEETIRSRFFEEVHHRYERGLLTDQDFYRTIQKQLPEKNRLSEYDFWRGWAMLLGEENGTGELLSQLTRNVDVWLLSNTNSNHILQEATRKYSFFRKVTGKVYSYEVGYRKPEREIFEIALKRANTSAEKALFIDDMPANIAQAQALGFTTILFTTADALKQELVQLGFIFEGL